MIEITVVEGEEVDGRGRALAVSLYKSAFGGKRGGREVFDSGAGTSVDWIHVKLVIILYVELLVRCLKVNC